MWLIMLEILSTYDKKQGQVFLPERPRIYPRSEVIFPISTSAILCTVSSGYFQKRNASRLVLTSYLKPVRRFQKGFSVIRQVYTLEISFATRIFFLKSRRHTALFCPVLSLNFELEVCAVISRFVPKPAMRKSKMGDPDLGSS